MAQQRFPVVRITTSATTTVIGSGCFVTQIVISCSAAGTGWTLKVQSKSSPVNILIPAFTLAVPTTGSPLTIEFDQPVFMPAGVDVVTAGTAGVVDVWVAAKQTDAGT